MPVQTTILTIFLVFFLITNVIDSLLEKDFVYPLDICPDNDVSNCQYMRRRMQKSKKHV